MILLTAFAGKENSSRLLMERAMPQGCEKLILTNSFSACAEQIVRAIETLRPGLVLSFGQKPGADRLYLETAAKRGAEILHTNADIPALCAALSRFGIQYRVSGNAGNYLCNHAYYAGLECISSRGLRTKMAFIHIPSKKDFWNFEKVLDWVNAHSPGDVGANIAELEKLI